MVRLWELLGNVYGQQFLKQWGSVGGEGFETWAQVLADLSPVEIKAGFNRLIAKRSEWAPNAMVFKALCLDLSEFGIPDAQTAYREACNKQSPKAKQRWSHPSVYLAGQQVGWFELAHKPERQMFPMFRSKYELLIQRFMDGEELIIEQAEEVPLLESLPLTPGQHRKKMDKLRADTGL
jgi:hypothetical protein